jgi:hypothetical protein
MKPAFKIGQFKIRCGIINLNAQAAVLGGETPPGANG